MNSPALGQPSERCVLVVDDELSIVNAIRRELSTPPLGRYRYAVDGFVDPAAALARAREKEFSLLSDIEIVEIEDKYHDIFIE